MALPNFLCVGTMKGGTTTLHDILKHHPEILLPSAQKELRFFDLDDNYRKGLHWYEAFFSDYQGQKAVGEIAPTYAYREDVPARMMKDLGADVKLIFSLRNPVDRAYSHYMMNCVKRYETHDFSAAVALEPERLKGDFTARRRFGYLDQGRYATQIRRFLNCFPRENMLFLTFEEDLLEHREEAFQKVYDLLGVQPATIDLNVWSYAGQPATIPIHPSLRRLSRLAFVQRASGTRPIRAIKRLLKKPIPGKLDPATRRQLIERHFADEIEDLQRLIGRDLRRWLAA